jgi:hypothetical protein
MSLIKRTVEPSFSRSLLNRGNGTIEPRLVRDVLSYKYLGLSGSDDPVGGQRHFRDN